MKKFTYTILVASTVLFCACNKFLDQEPDDRTKIDKPDKIVELIASAYPKATYVSFAESMSDNAEDKGAIGRDERNFMPWQFIDQTKTDYDRPTDYWRACYAAIAAANQGLASIEELGNLPSLNAAKGEALVARAYAHFMLALFFAKPYNEKEAASDLGIPYVEKPENVAVGNYTRGTLEEVYKKVERDLLEGISLIDDSHYKIPSFHFTKNAAYAFATRFYLFKKDYEQVVKYADFVAPTATVFNLLRPWNSTYSSLGYYDFRNTYTNSTQSANLLLAEAKSIWGRSFAGYNYGLTYSLLTEIFDRTKNPLGKELVFTTKIFGGTEMVLNIPKFSENFIKESISANFGEPYNVIPLFTVEEVLFNRAEALARLGRDELVLADLNTYLTKRIVNYTSTGAGNKLSVASVKAFYPGKDTPDALVEAVLNFKRQEFLFEGMRWLDIIRLGKVVVHRSVRGDIDLTLDAQDNRRILQLPTEVIAYGLEANPR